MSRWILQHSGWYFRWLQFLKKQSGSLGSDIGHLDIWWKFQDSMATKQLFQSSLCPIHLFRTVERWTNNALSLLWGKIFWCGEDNLKRWRVSEIYLLCVIHLNLRMSPTTLSVEKWFKLLDICLKEETLDCLICQVFDWLFSIFFQWK